MQVNGYKTSGKAWGPFKAPRDLSMKVNGRGTSGVEKELVGFPTETSIRASGNKTL